MPEEPQALRCSTEGPFLSHETLRSREIFGPPGQRPRSESFDGSYAVLRYCWGSTMPESGKKASKTLQTNRESINYALLPGTLIRFCRNFGVN